MEICNKYLYDLNNHTEEYFNTVQNTLSKQISLQDTISINDINSIAGVDLAYWNYQGKEYAVCCIVVLDYTTHQVIEKQYSYGEITVPYIAGYLAFRELPLIVQTVRKLNTTPDILMFDGNGYLHPRHMGIATHSSYILNKPTIGVAKTYYKINRVDFTMPPNVLNAYTDISIDGTVYGRAVRTNVGVKPIFVSCGNYLCLDTAMKITLSLISPKDSRLPITTRLADLETHTMREQLKNTML